MKKSAHEMSIEQAFKGGGGRGGAREAEQRREGDVEREEIEAARAWLRHLDAGRLG